MKITTNPLLLLSFCFLSVNSFAGTNADTLKSLFDEGTAAATAEDFPQRDFNTNKYIGTAGNLCTIIDGSDQPSKYNVSRTVRITPAHGPLISEKRQEKLVFGNTRNSYNLFDDPEVLSYNAVEEFKIQGIDLIVTNPIYKSWVDGADGTNRSVPAKLYARKSGQYIAFKVFIKHNATNVRDQNFYGYCYPNGSALF